MAQPHHDPPRPDTVLLGHDTGTSRPLITPTPTLGVGPRAACTPVDWTNTFVFTADAACPTPYEAGTYCGFVNPEDPCAWQPGGDGPPIHEPDTAARFRAHQPFLAEARAAPVPANYRQTFAGLGAAANGASRPGLGMHLLRGYDVAACAALCDDQAAAAAAAAAPGPHRRCAGFNVYVERDPAWNPWRCSCARPPSVTNYKCALWGAAADLAPAAAANRGQARGDAFEVVVVASNGYVRDAGKPCPDGPGSTSEHCVSPGRHPPVDGASVDDEQLPPSSGSSGSSTRDFVVIFFILMLSWAMYF